ncbi:MAG: type II secretion system protein GspG [Terrimicrobiaceae bacterium]
MMKQVFSGSVFSVQGRGAAVSVPLLASGLKSENQRASASYQGQCLMFGAGSATVAKAKNNRKLKTSVGFTLIELLVVIAIIAILAGLILSTAGYVQKKGATSRAEAEVAALSAALESYKADNGDYPTGTNLSATGNNNFLFTNLMPPASAANPKVYFEFNKGMTNTSGYVVDPFGGSYGYQYPGSNARSGTNFFDLWSTAGSTNTNAWIKNW